MAVLATPILYKKLGHQNRETANVNTIDITVKIIPG